MAYLYPNKYINKNNLKKNNMETTAKKTAKKSTAKSVTNSETKKAKAKKPTIKKWKDGKDRSKLEFNGKQYGKARLVQAIIEKYTQDHPGLTMAKLEEAFPNSLHPSGLIQTVNAAKRISKTQRRYFFKEPIKLADKKVAVCTEFGKDSIKSFLDHARKLGYTAKLVAA